ncbi:MAG TPA: dihydropteroate synthase [Desulfonatronum sp.]|nr:dihydropteroate synthase [Desulfonatronum sp.]
MDRHSRWMIKGSRGLDLSIPVIMGIVNCTPDSFFDGGRLRTVQAAVDYGMDLAAQGARILDVGGESTRPGAKRVALAEELTRTVPVLSGLARQRDLRDLACVLSVDTTKAGVAAAGLEAGAEIVNDISACRFDPELLDVLVQYRPGYVLMHSLGRPQTMQNHPRYKNVVEEILAFFQRQMDRFINAGLSEEQIILDPGIGFGKLLEHNLSILREMDRFLILGRPVLVGLSNKSLWHGLLDLELFERESATQVATALMAVKGVSVHRVHDVESASRTLRIVQALTACGA